MDYTLLWIIIPILIIAILFVILKNVSSFSIKTLLGAFICIVLIGSVLAPTINNYDNTDPENSIVNILKNDSTVYYDDYFDASKISSCSGNFEIVTIGEYSLVHATDVGTAAVEWIDGTTATYTIHKAPLDVFLIMGQSNSAYFHQNIDECDPVPIIGSSYYFGTPTRPLVYTSTTVPTAEQLATFLPDCGMYDMTLAPGEARIGNFDAPFAAEYYNLTKTKTYLVNTGITGITLSTLIPGGSNYHYTTAVFNAAMEIIDTTKYVPSFQGYIWAQGEGDYNTPVNTYKTMFLTLYDAIGDGSFNADWTTDNAYIIKTRSLDGGYACIAQKELATEENGIHIATSLPDSFTISNGLLDSDGIHYSQLGDNLIGVAVAKYIHTLL